MNHGEALIIWWRNGLKLPELPLDECIFPNAERLLKIERINADLLEACKDAEILYTEYFALKPTMGIGLDQAMEAIKRIRQAISKAEREKKP